MNKKMAIDAFYHLHKRKRIYERHEPYPHPVRWKRFLDKIIYSIGVLGPLMALHQVYKIWYLKDAGGVSAISWGAFAFFAIFWVIYGFAHKEKPIILAYTCWFAVEILIAVGAVLYG